MLYGINFRRFHTAIHGILLFDTKKKAETAYDILKAYENGKYEISEEEQSEESMQHFLQTEVWDKAVSEVSEIHYREIEPLMKDVAFQVNENGRVSTKSRNVRIVNNISVDVY